MIMKQKKILIIVCLALCLLVSGVYANEVSIAPASAEHSIGETQSYTVILDSALQGLSGFNITVLVQNPSVAQITKVTFDTSWASMPKNSSVPAASVWCKAVDLEGGSGTANIILCTVLIRADNYGTTNITIIPEKVEDRQGGRYTPSVMPATLTVPGGDAPASSFTANLTIGRAPLAVKFTDTSTNSPTAWKWYVNDALVGTTQNLEYTFATGAYNVRLNASNLVGGTNSSPTLIRAYAQPVAAFTAAPNPVSVNSPVQFTDTSIGSVTTWAWTFGDGTTSTSQSPAHTYTTAGNKTVTLSVGNPFETSPVATNFVVVVPPLDIRMSSNYTAGTVAPRAIQFNDTSGSVMHDWNWSFGDGTYSALQNPAHTFAKNGTYPVTFSANDTLNIRGTTTATLTFGLPPVPAFTTNVTLAYVNDAVLFTDKSQNMVNFNVAPNWSWNFGDGSPVTYGQGPKAHTYTTSGTYTANLTVFNAVGGPVSITKQITVDRMTGIPLAIPNVIVSGGNVTINMAQWAGGSFSYTSTQLTLYNLTYFYKVVFTGVITNSSGNITVNSTTNAAFFINPVNGTTPGGNVITSLVANMNTYNGIGMIDVEFGGSDPMLNATYQGQLGTSTLNDVFVVLNITTISSPTVTSSIINISVPYSWHLVYPATASAYDNKYTQIIAIHNGVPQLLVTTYGGDYWKDGVHYAFYIAPGPGFSTFGLVGASSPASPPAPGVNLTFHPRSATVPLGSNTTYSVILNTALQGLSGYNITIASSNASIAEIVRVTYPSWASMPKNSTLPADRAWFKAVDLEGTSGTTNITFCEITVRGDAPGLTTLVIIPEKVEDRQGGRYTPAVVSATLYVRGGTLPVANFSANKTVGTVPMTVQFTDESTGAPSAWSWNFGDGSTAISQHPLHTYVNAGTYTVSLTATNAGGSNTTTRTNYITVYAPRPTLWNMSMNVTSGTYNQNVVMGSAVSATRGYDVGLDIPVPPDPPGAKKIVYFSIEDAVFDHLSTDYKPPVNATNTVEFWTLYIKSNETVKVYWDTSLAGNPNLTFLWNDGTTTVNMRTVTNATLPAGEYYVNLSVSTTARTDMSLKYGWNLVSIPFTSAQYVVPANAISTIYSYNPVTRGYEGPVQISMLEPGKAYWVAATRDCIVNVTGQPAQPIVKGLKTGWNLIGGTDSSVPFSSITIDPSGSWSLSFVYGYNVQTRMYDQVTSFQSGKGYWGAVNRDCTITIP